MDISQLGAAPTATLHLKGIDGEPLYSGGDKSRPVRIRVYGPGTPQHADVEHRQTLRANERLRENEGRVVPQHPHAVRREAAEDLADLTEGSEHLTYGGDASLTGRALHVAVYADPALGFIVDQVARFANRWASFAPAGTAAPVGDGTA